MVNRSTTTFVLETVKNLVVINASTTRVVKVDVNEACLSCFSTKLTTVDARVNTLVPRENIVPKLTNSKDKKCVN